MARAEHLCFDMTLKETTINLLGLSMSCLYIFTDIVYEWEHSMCYGEYLLSPWQYLEPLQKQTCLHVYGGVSRLSSLKWEDEH